MGALHPLSRVINLGVRHQKKKERKPRFQNGDPTRGPPPRMNTDIGSTWGLYILLSQLTLTNLFFLLFLEQTRLPKCRTPSQSLGNPLLSLLNLEMSRNMGRVASTWFLCDQPTNCSSEWMAPTSWNVCTRNQCTANLNPTWGDIFESSKLTARTSHLPRFNEKRRSSFEL